MLERAAAAYGDPGADKYIWGLAYHWYGDVPFQACQRNGSAVFEIRSSAAFANVRQVAELRPDKHLIQTESCQELGDKPLQSWLGEWKLGERYAMNIISDMNNGCEGWIDWNLVLNEIGGPNHAGNYCVAPIICD